MTSPATSATIGFLGIGAMGLPMARRIHEAGMPISTADLSSAQVDKARELGMPSSTDAASLSECSLLFVVVATGEQLLGLLHGALMTGTGPCRTVVVMSTVGVDAVRAFESDLSARNIAVVDCPLTGGVVGAESGALSLFVAGSAHHVQEVSTILDVIGQPRYCGPSVGDGQSVKLVNQLLAAANLAVAAEAMSFAEALGLDPETTLALVRDGAGGSWMLRDRGPRMAQQAEGRPVLTHLTIFAKDTALVLNAAEKIGFRASILEMVAKNFQEAVASGLGAADDSSVVDLDRRSSLKKPSSDGTT
jgi:3-hydroxyisobutyrate dehydrogenase-like beta-hydroxyacid dehydrogenase